MEKWEFMERWVGSFVSKALDTCKVTLGIPVGKEWDWGWGGESQGRTGFISLTWSCRSSDYMENLGMRRFSRAMMDNLSVPSTDPDSRTGSFMKVLD